MPTSEALPETRTKRQAAKAATRQRVLEAARLLFAQNGYEAATIRDVARLAGMSTGAVFANFDGKEHLYREIHGHGPISPELGRDLRNVLQACARQFRAYEAHHRSKPVPDIEKANRNAALAEMAEIAISKAA